MDLAKKADHENSKYAHRAQWRWRHRIYGHDTIAMVWVKLGKCVELKGEDL